MIKRYIRNVFGCAQFVVLSTAALAQTTPGAVQPDSRFAPGSITAEQVKSFSGENRKVCGLVGRYNEPVASTVPAQSRFGMLWLYDSRFAIIVEPTNAGNFPIVNNEGIFRGYANKIVCVTGTIGYADYEYDIGITRYIDAQRPGDIQVLPESAKAQLPGNPCVVQLPGERITLGNRLGGRQ